jgi:CheY-like chemotaxis protein
MPHEPRIRGVRVLVVDDSEINREVAQHILQANGASVSQAKDGQEAVEWLFAHPDSVDIVLMDIQMPRLDGYEATLQIRQNPQFADLPILALTAGAFSNLQLEALKAGMNDFISKPFDVEKMLAMILHWTAHKPAALATGCKETAQSAPAANPGQAVSPVAETAELDLPGIDLEAAMRSWQDINIYQTYLTQFVEKYQQVGVEIAHAAEQGDYDAVKRLAHKLKGVALTLALPEIAAKSIDIETALREEEAPEPLLKPLQAAIDQVEASLNTLLAKTAKMEKYQSFDYDGIETPEGLSMLLAQLLFSLNNNNPEGAEKILMDLENLINPDTVKAIKAAVLAFNFREAEALVQSIKDRIKPANGA